MTTHYDFKTSVNRENTSAVKTSAEIVESELGLKYYPETIPLWVADMDFSCSPEILEALQRRVGRGILGYTFASSAYYQSVIDWYRRRHGMKIEREWLVYSNGTVTAIRNLLRAFTEEGEGVVIQTPVYYPFAREIESTNRKVLENRLLKDEENRYSIDFDGFERLCQRADTKMFIYCNPHNPIGKIWTAEESRQLMKICGENGVLFFSDEIHCDLIRKSSTFTSVLSSDLELGDNSDLYENTIVATAVNKTFNVAGLHITNLVIPSQSKRDKLNRFTGNIGISPLALEATMAAYNDSEEWVRELNDVLDENIEYLDNFIKERLPKLRFQRPEGTYLVWIDFSRYGLGEKELLRVLAEEAKLILEGGSMFGVAGEGFIRMNIASPKSVLIEALNRLSNVLDHL